jgi:hypothetical protein
VEVKKEVEVKEEMEVEEESKKNSATILRLTEHITKMVTDFTDCNARSPL